LAAGTPPPAPYLPFAISVEIGSFGWEAVIRFTRHWLAEVRSQGFAQIKSWTRHREYENKVYLLPEHLDEKVVRASRSSASGWPSAAQGNYLNLPRSDPFKPEHYRY
jgi:hypothetical protein